MQLQLLRPGLLEPEVGGEQEVGGKAESLHVEQAASPAPAAWPHLVITTHPSCLGRGNGTIRRHCAESETESSINRLLVHSIYRTPHLLKGLSLLGDGDLQTWSSKLALEQIFCG